VDALGVGEAPGIWELQWVINPSYITGEAIYTNFEYPNDDEWHHVAATFYKGTTAVYIDGILKVIHGNTTPILSRCAGSRCYIGNDHDGVSPFWGQIDEVRISEAVPSEPRCGFEGYLEGDINRDCYVNFSDFCLVAESWLK
jgi:hypothetical protein